MKFPVCNILISLLLLSQCSFTSNSERGGYLIRYLNETRLAGNNYNNANVYILYTDRCKTCKPDRIDKIKKLLLQYDNNYVILNYPDTALANKLQSNAKIYLDNSNFDKYGLNAPENQIFIIRNGKVVFESFIDEAAYSKIRKKAGR